MFSGEEWSQIIGKLLSLTNSGIVQWTDNTNHGYFFAASEEVTYVVGSQDDDGMPPYELRINEGSTTQFRTLGSLATVDAAAENDVRTSLFALWDAAQRSANDAPAIAAKLLAQLDSLDDNAAD